MLGRLKVSWTQERTAGYQLVYTLACSNDSVGILNNLFEKAQFYFLPLIFNVYKECNEMPSEHSEMHWHCRFPFSSLYHKISWLFLFFFLRKHCHKLVTDACNTDPTSSFKTTKADRQWAVSSHRGLWL